MIHIPVIFVNVFKFTRKAHKSSITITELCCKLLIKKLHASATFLKGLIFHVSGGLAWETDCQYFDYSRLAVPSELNNNLTYGLAMKKERSMPLFIQIGCTSAPGKPQRTTKIQRYPKFWSSFGLVPLFGMAQGFGKLLFQPSTKSWSARTTSCWVGAVMGELHPPGSKSWCSHLHTCTLGQGCSIEI